ncbi:hypothetical protein [Kutzneria sp. NPDC051319]|uniref:hypothetical protein n=1 Tax=Kutzneria sp. NPDC051319 TaxID=3155047 RepID=UPI003420E838
MTLRKLVVAVLAAVVVVGGAAPVVAQTTTITADYGSDAGAATQVASGFLHGVSVDSPAQYLVDGVKVKSQRGADHSPNLPSLFDPATYARVSATGARLRVGLYYYSADPANPHHNYRPGDNGDFTTWTSIVNGVLTEAAQKKYNVGAWITWNEPDIQWGSRYTTTYIQAHKKAYDTVKARNPSYQVEAPELGIYNFTKLQQFLTYCRDNHCLPDVLSWHELTATPSDVPGHTAQITNWMRANGITPMPIAITEYQGTGYGNANAWTVGANVRWLAQFERSVPNGLQDALYSDWEYNGSNTSFKGTLGNAVDHSGTQPKGVWWNYNAYKSMTGRMVKVASPSPTIVDALGSADTGAHRSVLLIGNQTATGQPVALTLKSIGDVPGLSSSGAVHVRAERIDNAATVTATKVVLDSDVRLSSGSATVSLSALPGNAAYKVLVTPATAGAPVTHYTSESLRSTPGRSTEYSFAVNKSGVFDVRAAAVGALDVLYVDVVMVGAPQGGDGDPADYGTLALSAGEHTLKFVVAGTDPSGAGHERAFDLTKVGQGVDE